jgi:hypothetical protein
MPDLKIVKERPRGNENGSGGVVNVWSVFQKERESAQPAEHMFILPPIAAHVPVFPFATSLNLDPD